MWRACLQKILAEINASAEQQMNLASNIEHELHGAQTAKAQAEKKKETVVEMFRELQKDLHVQRERYENLNAVAIANKRDALESIAKATRLEAENQTK